VPDVPAEYRTKDGWVLIELRLSRLAQLFNSFDPSPFYERDLDDDAEAYIVACAREVADRQPCKVVIHLPTEEAARERPRNVERAINRHFLQRARNQRRDTREVFRQGRTNLAVGLSCLLTCLSLRWLLGLLDHGRSFLPQEVVSESLLIVGWVAMWRPIESFLYNWRPSQRTFEVYLRLSRVPVEITARPEPPGAP
jgi:hypothetical protein